MRNKIVILLLLLCVFSLGLSISKFEVASAMGATSAINSEEAHADAVDYAGNVKLDMNSETLKAEVDVKLAVDGDTVHFNISEPSFSGSVLKARFLAVNTPESTGQIEPYGKTASDFTKEKVMNAVSIIVESDTASWNADSTGDRYLVWVWYKPSANEDYRNLNIEILQNGLAIASNSAQNRYGSICMDALNQAKSLGLNVHSGKADPNFYYGEAIELDIKGLRMDVKNYVGKKVAFEGVVYRDSSNTVYVEEYDTETGIYYGIAVYYGFNTSGDALDIIQVGNRVRIVGTVSEYQGTYQVSGLQYRVMKPNDPDNVQKLGEGFEGAYYEVSASDFKNKNVTIDTEDQDGNITSKTFSYASLAVNSSVTVKNLKVVDVYTTNNEESSSIGAMTLTCEDGNTTISVRTEVLRFSNGTIITEESFKGKSINVKGMIDYFNGSYQIKVFSPKDITFNDFEIAKPEINIEVAETAEDNQDVFPIITINGNAEYAVNVTLVRPNKRSEKLLLENLYSFTTSGDGVYTIKVVVEDIHGNKTTLDKTVTVAAPVVEEGCGGALAASIFGLSILASAVFVLKKKKH